MNNSNGFFGEPVQILKLNPINRKFELDNVKLNQIFRHKHLEKVNLSVVSIAGAFRKGKSFLLSFFLRYLKFYYNDDETNPNANWLGDENSRLSGFSWRGGSERHTTGIWVWSKVFTKTMPDGQQIGIVLMDTQGTFDNESSMHHNVTIFALSTMLSSIQIYNLFNNIQEDDLQHLQLFTEYGRIAANDSESDSKPFQQIMFLIRDWSFPYEHKYGLFGGAQKLQKMLEINADQSSENQSVRKHLRSCFDEITCFLMPHPGEEIRTNPQFDGKLSDIKEEFVENLRRLIPYLLKPTNVARTGLKKIHGVPINPTSFCDLIQQYWKVFKSGTMPEAKNILEATTEAMCQSALSDITQWYFKTISNFAESNDMDAPQLLNSHKNLVDEALKKYDGRVVMGDQKTRMQHRQQLQNVLQEHITYFLGVHQSKKSKSLEETVNKLSAELKELQKRDNKTQPDELLLTIQWQLRDFMKVSYEQQMERIQRMERNITLGAVRQNNERPQRRPGICSIM